MFDFHNTFFCIAYIVISFCWVLGLYFKIVFLLSDDEKMASQNIRMAAIYIIGILLSAAVAYYLFQFVRFIQFYY